MTTLTTRSALSRRERVDAVLRGETPDRIPVSAWRHFIPEELRPDSLSAASLDHFRNFDWDWLKINPRATMYAEAWGSTYNYDHYSSVLPELLDSPIRAPADLDGIAPLSGTDGVFAEHLDVVKQIKAKIGDAHFLQTVFSPVSILSFLIARPARHDITLWGESQREDLRRYLQTNPQGAHAALNGIAETTGRYAAACIEAGASGIFFAIVKLAYHGAMTREEFMEFGKPYDLQVLRHIQGAAFNMLHICGARTYFDAVTDYSVHALNWATLGQHNPDLSAASTMTDKVLVGGVDEIGTLQYGSPEDVAFEALTAIRVMEGRRLLLTPGCGTALDVPDDNLHAMRRAAQAAAEPTATPDPQ